MDSLTQACLGAAIGGAVLGRRLGRRAVLAGAALGTLPDLDVVIDYGDAVADYTYHRGFSHSLIVLTALAILLATLTARLAPAWDIPLRRWVTFYATCLLTHPLLDAFTTYGTQLWWPLATPPVSWASIFIIDPLYTLPLLVSVLYVLARGYRPRALNWGLALSTLYLAFSLGAKLTIDQRMAPVLAAQGLQDAPRLVQPTPFNTLLWRITVVEGDHYYEALSGLLDSAPPTLERFPRGGRHADAAQALPSGQRLQWFAGPFLRYRIQHDDGNAWLIATDLRLGFPGFHPFNFRLARRDEGEWQPVTTREIPGRPADTAALMRLLNRAITPDMSLCPSAFLQAEKMAGPGTCPSS
ncbi:metal-dependent hydrolase [Halomonas sp. McH1-25]|uniref:metal-dependent hydrolase n=1 Tax=unclassified Halomonas TaxID=2609666 RepID=UPI001EF5F47C|nr:MULTISPECIES: metal-dependent hydrolase [unclassified Halomonas]MCG7601205.1 metal-dependent hydrolase [Halomonas sp. McH1-25]MCP1341895.1 metal-dependent hydrolase [Halomonas sp. FL8]MCP1360160.1 metal-dependent hydrolase [Halomonas sp. BBD45]